MNYKLLSSLYYENKEKYDSLFFSRTNGENCIRLNFKIHENDAFYCITPHLHELYIKILELNLTVSQQIDVLPHVALNQFAKSSLLDEIILTNNMEGVHSTRREINGVLQSLENGNKKKRFYGLVKKYDMMSKERISLATCEDVRKVYDELVLPEVRKDKPNNVPDGKIFRKDLTNVESQTGKVLHKGLFPEKKIISAMEDALNILNSPLPTIETIALFHYLIGYIHPFYDGNGRLSRFISSYLLSSNLKNPLIGYRLSYTIKENISAYYRAFQICNNKKNRGDLTPFVLMFTDIIYQSMDNLRHALQKRLDKLNYYTSKMEKLTCFADENSQNLAFILIQARLFSENGITKTELAENLDISMTTLNKRLKAIHETGYIINKTIGHSLHFEFNIDKLDETT